MPKVLTVMTIKDTQNNYHNININNIDKHSLEQQKNCKRKIYFITLDTSVICIDKKTYIKILKVLNYIN